MVAARGQAVLCQNQGKQQPQECDKGKKALIRRATESDIPRITDIRNNVRENKLIDPRRVTIEDVRWFISNPGIFLGEEDGRVVGFSAADPRNGNIWALFLDQAYEGRGIARALLQQACAVLSEAGFPADVAHNGSRHPRRGILPSGRMAGRRAQRQRTAVHAPEFPNSPTTRHAAALSRDLVRKIMIDNPLNTYSRLTETIQ